MHQVWGNRSRSPRWCRSVAWGRSIRYHWLTVSITICCTSPRMISTPIVISTIIPPPIRIYSIWTRTRSPSRRSSAIPCSSRARSFRWGFCNSYGSAISTCKNTCISITAFTNRRSIGHATSQSTIMKILVTHLNTLLCSTSTIQTLLDSCNCLGCRPANRNRVSKDRLTMRIHGDETKYQYSNN